MNEPLPSVVRELPAPAPELSLGLFLGDQRVASFTAEAGALGMLETELGMTREDVRALAFSAMSSVRHDRELPAVLMTTPRCSTTSLERFASLYFHTVGEHTVAGCVWFDVPSSTTGPFCVPNAARNHIRLLVNRALTRESANPRVVDAFLRWDAARLEKSPGEAGNLEAGDGELAAPEPAERLSLGEAVSPSSLQTEEALGTRAADVSAPAGMTFLERLDDEHGSVVIGWLVPGVLYARFSGAISLLMGQEYVRRLRTLVGGHDEIRYFTDYSAIESYDVGVFPLILAALKDLQGQFKRITARPWATAPTAPAQSRLAAFGFLEFVATADEFEARMRAAAPFSGLTPESPPPAASPTSYTYAFDIEDFESGRFIATRYGHCAFRPRGAWVCVARSDEHALQLAHQAALFEWATPRTRNAEEFTVRFLDGPPRSQLDRRK